MEVQVSLPKNNSMFATSKMYKNSTSIMIKENFIHPSKIITLVNNQVLIQEITIKTIELYQTNPALKHIK